MELVERGGGGESGKRRGRLNCSRNVMYKRIDKLKKERKKPGTKQAVRIKLVNNIPPWLHIWVLVFRILP